MLKHATRAAALALVCLALPLGGCLSTSGPAPIPAGSQIAAGVGSVLGGIKAGLQGTASLAPAACTDIAVAAGLANAGVAIAATAPAAGVTAKTTSNVANAGSTIVTDCAKAAAALQAAGQAAASN